MRVTHRAALLSAVVGLFALPTLPASAAMEATTTLPETVLKVKSIDWQARTGNVEVTARVKCTGDGTFRWAAALEQGDIHARNSSQVPCDDDGYRSTLVLDPRGGRFHPGVAEFTLEQIVMNDQAGIGSASIEFIRISPR